MQTLFGTLDALERSMSFQRERHTAIAKNIANLDTPGYQPIDLVEIEQPGGGTAIAQIKENGEGAGIDGNAVSLEKELAKIDENRVRYSTSAELVSRRLALLRYTASDGAA